MSTDQVGQKHEEQENLTHWLAKSKNPLHEYSAVYYIFCLYSYLKLTSLAFTCWRTNNLIGFLLQSLDVSHLP